MTRSNEWGQPIGESLTGWAGAQAPGDRVLTPSISAEHAAGVCLEPLRNHHDAALFEQLGPGAAPEQLFTYMTFEQPRALEEWAGLASSWRQRPDMHPYAICVDGAPRGVASLQRCDPAHGTVEVGTVLYSPALQRTTAATLAMFTLADYVFFELGMRRYEWKCDALNAASRRAAVRLGFAYEGTWRNATTYKGRTRDTAWYAMTDDDWDAIRSTYTAWFACPGREFNAHC